MKAKKVIIFTNGNIMAFDKRDRPMEKCYGCILDVGVIRNLNGCCGKDTKFYIGNWEDRVRSPVKLRWWFEKGKLRKALDEKDRL